MQDWDLYAPETSTAFPAAYGTVPLPLVCSKLSSVQQSVSAPSELWVNTWRSFLFDSPHQKQGLFLGFLIETNEIFVTLILLSKGRSDPLKCSW